MEKTEVEQHPSSESFTEKDVSAPVTSTTTTTPTGGYNTESALPPKIHSEASYYDNASAGRGTGTPRSPNKWRVILRTWQAIAAPAVFILQAGASAYTNHDTPAAINVVLLYFVCGACSASFIWSLFMIYVYFSRRFGNGGKVKRTVAFGVDVCFAVLLGIGVCAEIGMYKCPPGELEGWCDLFNSGIFFGKIIYYTYNNPAVYVTFEVVSHIRNQIIVFYIGEKKTLQAYLHFDRLKDLDGE
ncbi:hypothetical protein BDB00DRAFT_898734 [Zychaea mexicana]|uniref:uncharacterized protein n=1 Tax=Zychaea mexicana TaxID=64656 RepID=UPI0022FE627A|nr:uncharacterized protein BDB00DRAFT_898734 [Zychaea mexicana]KAI9499393.1 hypothetical protein BDB00DRAFT_898734 [Zychaea mexicana]